MHSFKVGIYAYDTVRKKHCVLYLDFINVASFNEAFIKAQQIYEQKINNNLEEKLKDTYTSFKPCVLCENQFTEPGFTSIVFEQTQLDIVYLYYQEQTPNILNNTVAHNFTQNPRIIE